MTPAPALLFVFVATLFPYRVNSQMIAKPTGETATPADVSSDLKNHLRFVGSNLFL